MSAKQFKIKSAYLLILLMIMINDVFSQPVSGSLTICAVRVEFVEDNNKLTTGNGRFMIDTVTTDQFAIDPAPHDKPYFQDQITAVSNYYKNVSRDQLSISGDVYPVTDNGAYLVQNTMGYYNPNTTDEEINRGLSRFFVDAVKAADTDTDLRINDYDLLVVFHAGVGRDVSLDYDETPQDLASLFITLDFLKESLGDDFTGIPVKDGVVTRGIILPETENQQDYQIALTGIFASNIGTYLGLYDLFSPSEQRTGIGRFGLMDFGLMNLNGLVPSMPCAFSRVKLGWDEPLVLNKPQNNVPVTNLSADNTGSGHTTVKIPINDDEYYLMEYRGDDAVNIDSEYVELLENRDKLPSYLELLKTYHPEKITVSENGVLLSVSDYDLGIGGAGLLIWHIDESVIREKGPENKINDDPDYRAVDLEEADGSQDIGHIYDFLEAGYEKDLGWFADFWFSNRPKDLKDFELYRNEFSPRSRPNTNANLNQSKSHITVKNFSTNLNTVMTFDFIREKLQLGYPINLAIDANDIGNMISGKVANHPDEFLFISSKKGKIFALSDSGNGLFYPEKRLFARINETEAGINTPLALADLNEDNRFDLLFTAGKNYLYGFSLSDSNTDSLANEAFTAVPLPADIITPLVTAGSSIYFGCSNDSAYRFNHEGQKTGSYYHPSDAVDLVVGSAGIPVILSPDTRFAAMAPADDQTARIIEWNLSDDGFKLCTVNAENPDCISFVTAEKPAGPFSLADIDGNGVYDLVFNSPEKVYAYNQSGAIITGFPIKPVLALGDSLTGAPLILDANGDGLTDIIAGTKKGQILGFSALGKSLPEFPLSVGAGLNTSPMVGNYDADEELELTAATINGSLYMWQLSVTEADAVPFWTQARMNATNNKLIVSPLTVKMVGGSLMPPERAFNYPNPNKESFTIIRYYLNEDADVEINIYDASGTPVKTIKGPGIGHADNEVKWDLTDIASGVYLCHIEAKSGNSSDGKIIKIMVIQ
ncbi:MAG: T9SS type A sorting domain-containing protein [Calditrichaceae bacterium]|nr:T9SS type A sorting domain-containing protein [Calditrichaceae bacterium]MBN2709185.1 T9SS type A sorting domain-containing protein [Calditrichaceae bacterium]